MKKKRIFVVLYKHPGALASDDGDSIGVRSTHPLARLLVQSHAESVELQGEWYVEEWELDGEFVTSEQVYPQ